MFSSVRARQWWEFKSGPVLALAYGTALQARVRVLTLWPTLIGIVVALAGLAAWANLLNDWTDIADDLKAGKPNRASTRPASTSAFAVVVAAVIGWSAALWLRPGTAGLLLYGANGLAFLLYSVPPVRLKTRGGPGLLADACGAHALPALFAVVSLAAAARLPLGAGWLTLVTVWSVAYGLRGIIWHQLADYENDRRTGNFTFVCRVGVAAAQRIAEWVWFPVEIAALGGIIWWCGSPLPLVFLAFDVALIWLRRVHYEEVLVVVTSPERFRIALHEFSDTLLPIAFLIAATLRHPWDGVILASHVLLFPIRLRHWLRDWATLLPREVRRLARTRT